MMPQAVAAIWHARADEKSVFTTATGATPVLKLARRAAQAVVYTETARHVMKELRQPITEKGDSDDAGDSDETEPPPSGNNPAAPPPFPSRKHEATTTHSPRRAHTRFDASGSFASPWPSLP